jgi:hypothetical protein
MGFFAIAKSEATKQSILFFRPIDGLLRSARNDEDASYIYGQYLQGVTR